MLRPVDDHNPNQGGRSPKRPVLGHSLRLLGALLLASTMTDAAWAKPNGPGVLRSDSGKHRLTFFPPTGTVEVRDDTDRLLVRLPIGPSLMHNGKEVPLKHGALLHLNTHALTVSAEWENGQRGRLSITPEGPAGYRIQTIVEGDHDIRQSFEDHGESFYGLWEHHFGKNLDLRGTDLPMFSTKPGQSSSTTNVRSPFFFTTQGWGITVHSTANGVFRLGAGGQTSITYPERILDFSLILGTPREILRQYATLTGLARIPPPWAFRPIFWRDDASAELRGASTAQESILRDLQEAEELGIRPGAMMIDRPYGSGRAGYGNYDFAKSSFPDPRGLVQTLASHDTVLMVWIANRMLEGSYEEAQRQGFLFPGGKRDWPALDLRKKKAREWWVGQLDRFATLGIRGFKIDRGDEGEIPDVLANEHAELIPQTAAAALQRRFGDDWLLLSRNAFNRARQYTAVWSGDPENTFAGLRDEVRHGLRAGFLNFPVWGSDTGGYRSTPDKELFIRWIQMSAFSPLMEILIDHEHDVLWDDFGKETLDVLRDAVRLRTQLSCYLDRELRKSVAAGLPLMRALVVEFPDDPEVKDMWDEYLFGDALLVAPVLYRGLRSREVYLPEGTWRRFPDGKERLSGRSWVKAQAKLSEVPVYIREGFSGEACDDTSHR